MRTHVGNRLSRPRGPRLAALALAPAAALPLAAAMADAGGMRRAFGWHFFHQNDRGGAVYVMNNSADANAILVFGRDAGGHLRPLPQATAMTGGKGGSNNAPIDPLGSQGALVYDEGTRMLFAVNAGDNTVHIQPVLAHIHANDDVIGFRCHDPLRCVAQHAGDSPCATLPKIGRWPAEIPRTFEFTAGWPAAAVPAHQAAVRTGTDPARSSPGFPLGVAAMLEAADLVVSGRHTEKPQDESLATYEGWCRDAEARINWNAPVDAVYNLIRGCSPSPGAWIEAAGSGRLRVLEARKQITRRFGDVAGKPGEVIAVGAHSLTVAVQGGAIELLKVRQDGGEKMSGAALANALGLQPGSRIGLTFQQ